MLIFLLFLILSPIIVAICVFLVVLFFSQILKLFFKPKLSRKWDSLHQKIAEIDLKESGEIFIRNIRNAMYNPNYEWENKIEYQNKKFNLNNLEKIWLLVNPYSPLQSHVILSFQFGSEQMLKSFLSISYEVRKTNPENFNIFSILFKSFEGFYLISTEEDCIYLRTNIRPDTPVYLFPLEASKEQIQRTFKDLVSEIQIYKEKAFTYDIWNRNCLSEIFKHLYKNQIIKTRNKFKYFDILKLLYNQKIVSNTLNLNFTEFRKKYSINKKTKGLLPDENFSIKIRS